MDVSLSSLRAELATYIEHVRAGEEIVVTDRGTPVARILPVDAAPALDALTRRGVLGRANDPQRPTARGAARVRARHGSVSVSDLVSDLRD